MKHKQLGGTFAGLLIGVVLGLAIAIGVAMSVSKLPIPFMKQDANTRPTTLDAAEAERNRTWNPNSALSGARGPAAPSDNAVAPVTVPANGKTPTAQQPPATPEADPLGDLAARLSQSGNTAPVPAVPSATTNTAAVSGAPSADNYQYFVQAGAFRTQGDADAQRARLAMLGWDAGVSQREQQGQAVFRVRVGPFNRSQDATNLKQQLDAQGIDSAIVRQAR